MHICIVMSEPIPPEDGIGNFVYSLAKKLVKADHKVTILTRGSWNRTQKENIGTLDIIRVRFIPLYPIYLYIFGLFINKEFKSLESHIDIVHIHSPLSPLIKTSLPIIATIHSPMLTDVRSMDFKGILDSPIAKFMVRFVSYPLELRLLRRADMITTVSSDAAHKLSEYGMNPQEIEVIGNGVDHNIFTPSKNKSNDKYILFIGRLTYGKGLFDLIECGKDVCRKYPDISFVITGKGDLLSKLQKKVNELGLINRFKFVNFIDSNEKETLIKLYQNATIYIMPSHTEGLPTVLLEAMSCGLPIVATAVGGNIEVISHGENGILIPPKNPNEMARALSMLLDDDDMRIRLGDAARKTIEERYSWDMISNKIIRLYKVLLEEKA